MSYYYPNAPQPPQPAPHGGGSLLSKLLPPGLAAIGGLIVAVPVVIIATSLSTEDSRPAAPTTASVDQSLLGQVPYGSR